MAKKQKYMSPHIDIIPQDVETALCAISMANGGNNINTGSGGIGEEGQLSKDFFFDSFTNGNLYHSKPSSNRGYTLSNPWGDNNSTPPTGNGCEYND